MKVLEFYEVVPVPALLEALAGDAPAVAHRVQRLVLPFYYSGRHHVTGRTLSSVAGCPHSSRIVAHRVQRLVLPFHLWACNSDRAHGIKNLAAG